MLIFPPPLGESKSFSPTLNSSMRNFYLIQFIKVFLLSSILSMLSINIDHLRLIPRDTHFFRKKKIISSCEYKQVHFVVPRFASKHE